MKKLRLCFLWHMHQPYYKDDLDGTYHMPWVYLHGLKDYYELPKYHEKYNKLKGTYNLVPSLLVQLKDYEDTDISDTFLRLIQKHPSKLTKDERDTLVPQLFFLLITAIWSVRSADIKSCTTVKGIWMSMQQAL